MNENLLLSRSDRVDKYFPIIITILYSLCTSIGMYYHELWRDELDIYARLIYNGFLRYGGPSGGLDFGYLLYNSLLYILLRLTPSFAAYQGFHLLVITAAIYIFNRYSNFNYIQKFLFTFGYFTLFEYGIISRWYGFFILLLFIVVYLLTREKKNYILISIFLLVLANHNISAAMFSVSLAIYTTIHIINGFKTYIFTPETKKEIIVSLIILGGGSVLLILQYASLYITAGNTFEALGHAPLFMTIRAVWNSYIPIADFSRGGDFWDTNIFPFPVIYPLKYDINVLLTGGNIFTSVMSVLFILISSVIFSKKVPVLITFMFNTVLYFIFIHFFFRASFIRHQGLLLIIFVYCCWLYKYSDADIKLPVSGVLKPSGGLTGDKFVAILFTWFVTVIFSFQFIAGALVYPRSIKYQFTKAWDTANYIKTNNYNDYVIVGARDYAVLPIAVILDRYIYLPQTNTLSKYVDYADPGRKKGIYFSEVIDRGIEYLTVYNRKVLILLNSDFRDLPTDDVKINNNILLKKIKDFTGDIIRGDEQYSLYELKKI